MGGHIEFQIKEHILSLLNDTFYRIFLIIIHIIVCIDLGFIFQIDPFFFEISEDIVFDRLRKPVLKIEESLLTQIRNLIIRNRSVH